MTFWIYCRIVIGSENAEAIMRQRSRGKLDRRIEKIDRLFMQLSVRQINPMRVLAASIVAHDRRNKAKKVGRAST